MDDFLGKKDIDESGENTEAPVIQPEVNGDINETATEIPQAENNESEAYEAVSSTDTETECKEDPYKTEPPQSPFGAYGYAAPQNTINYTDVRPISDYRPMSRGLKLFALIMAAVIMLTGASAAGYFLGKNSVKSGTKHSVSVNLAAKPADTDEMTPAQVYENVKESVVGIVVYNSAGNGAQASGVFYTDDGYIVTNDHIYAEVPAAKFKIYTDDGKEYDAKYVAGDQVSDLAVLKIDAKGFKAAEFGDSEQIVFGENVAAVGRPSDATDASSITKGIISSTGRRVRTTTNYSAKLIQTDSAINPGSSGGALVNMYGQVIGITSSKLAGNEYDAVGYAIPTKTVKRIVEELISKGKVVSRAKLGITYTAINSVTAEINDYDYVGLLVASVSEDSDLYGKVNAGDVITHINDIEVTSDDIVLDIIEDSSAGDSIKVTVITKAGSEKTFDAVLKANTSESSYSTKIESNNNQDGSQGSDSSGGGTFNFPFGE